MTEARSTSLGGKDSVDMGSERAEEEARWRSDCWQGTGSENKSVREKVKRIDRESRATETGRGKEVVRLLGT